MKSIAVTPIGVIRSPFKCTEKMPIQPPGAAEVTGHADIFPEYAAGLKDLAGFSHIHLIFYFHCSSGFQLEVVPFLDTEIRGVFATRSPRRPARIGLSTVELVSVQGTRLELRGVDILDNTPLLDIKPHVPAFDNRENVRTGWVTADMKTICSKKSDHRFS